MNKWWRGYRQGLSYSSNQVPNSKFFCPVYSSMFIQRAPTLKIPQKAPHHRPEPLSTKNPNPKSLIQDQNKKPLIKSTINEQKREKNIKNSPGKNTAYQTLSFKYMTYYSFNWPSITAACAFVTNNTIFIEVAEWAAWRALLFIRQGTKHQASSRKPLNLNPSA